MLTFVRLFQISYRLDFEMSVFLQKFGYNGQIGYLFATNADSALSNLFAVVISFLSLCQLRNEFIFSNYLATFICYNDRLFSLLSG